MTEAVRRLHEAGVPIHAGTDVMNPFVVPGASLHEEIRNLAAAGFTAEEALASATIVPGGFLDPAMRGGVQVGAPADLAIFRRDPTRDLADLTTLEAVVADGRLYPRSALDGTLARSKAEFDGPLADRVGMLLARLAMRWVRSQ
jgi:imidazolonepropionase-like amidohydrolase